MSAKALFDMELDVLGGFGRPVPMGGDDVLFVAKSICGGSEACQRLLVHCQAVPALLKSFLKTRSAWQHYRVLKGGVWSFNRERL